MVNSLAKRAFAGVLSRRAAMGTLFSAAICSQLSPRRAWASESELSLLTWEGYNFPAAMKGWAERNGVKVNVSTIASQDDVQAKLLSAGSDGDFGLISYFQAYGRMYDEMGILAPLDPARLPNLYSLYPQFAELTKGIWADEDGSRIGVPFQWGAMGLNYNKQHFPTPPDSYEVMFAREMEGKVTVMDDPIGAYMLASHILGFDVAALSRDQFDKVNEWLVRLVRQTRGVSTSYGDGLTRMVSGDAILMFQGYAGVTLFAKNMGSEDIGYVLPKEGAYTFCDTWAIPKNAPPGEIDLAYSWINEMLRPEVNAAAVESVTLGGTVKGVEQYFSKGSIYDYGELAETLKKAPFYMLPPSSSDHYATYPELLEKWQEIKTAS